jgi:hypothetical protein
MKKLFIAVPVCIFISASAIAQPWYKSPGIPSTAFKEGQKPNFHQLRETFHAYWKNKTVSENESENAGGGGYQQFARWEHFVSRRAAPSGEMFEPDALMREYQTQRAVKKQ